jgi:putative DNA primase/helicase
MIEMAKSEPGIIIKPGELDTDPFLLSIDNGTIDLRTGELRPHRREDRITKLVPITWDPDAACPAWLVHNQETSLE